MHIHTLSFMQGNKSRKPARWQHPFYLPIPVGAKFAGILPDGEGVICLTAEPAPSSWEIGEFTQVHETAALLPPHEFAGTRVIKIPKTENSSAHSIIQHVVVRRGADLPPSARRLPDVPWLKPRSGMRTLHLYRAVDYPVYVYVEGRENIPGGWLTCNGGNPLRRNMTEVLDVSDRATAALLRSAVAEVHGMDPVDGVTFKLLNRSSALPGYWTWRLSTATHHIDIPIPDHLALHRETALVAVVNHAEGLRLDAVRKEQARKAEEARKAAEAPAEGPLLPASHDVPPANPLEN